jgi:hypothetical protein
MTKPQHQAIAASVAISHLINEKHSKVPLLRRLFADYT